MILMRVNSALCPGSELLHQDIKQQSSSQATSRALFHPTPHSSSPQNIFRAPLCAVKLFSNKLQAAALFSFLALESGSFLCSDGACTLKTARFKNNPILTQLQSIFSPPTQQGCSFWPNFSTQELGYTNYNAGLFLTQLLG